MAGTIQQGSTLPEITCPNCRTSFLLTDALRLEIEEGVLDKERAQHRVELERLRLGTQEETRKVVGERFAIDLQNAREDAEEQRALAQQLRETLVGLNKELRKMSNEGEAQRLRNERLLREQTEAIRVEERERALEANRLKHLETEKKLKDAQADAERLRRRLEQGSPQTQGEVLELDLETQLRQLFPDDEVVEVKKGQRGADVRQVVLSPLGTECGTILWETKNAQWRPAWVGKLKADCREAAADHGVLISAHTPEAIGLMGHFEGALWGARPQMAAILGTTLRQSLLQLNAVTALNVSKDQRIEGLHRYITGPEFRHRIQAIQESYRSLQEELEKEKRWFSQKWAREEKYIRGVVDNALGMYGDFEGLNGSRLAALTAVGPEDLAS